jgi:hypothetical protein
MTEVTSLESILEGGKSESQPAAEVTAKAEETVLDVQKEEPAKVEESAPTADKDGHDQKIPVAALQDERRQTKAARERAEAAEKRALALEEQLNSLTKSDGPQRPDVFEDQDAAFQHIENDLRGMVLNERINLSREMMLETKSDYEETERAFIDAASRNPLLVQQMQTSPNPAKFAYQTGKNILETQRLTDPTTAEKLRSELREEVRKEELAKLEKLTTPEEKRKALALKTPDLNNAASATSGQKTASKKSLEELVG